MVDLPAPDSPDQAKYLALLQRKADVVDNDLLICSAARNFRSDCYLEISHIQQAD